MKKNLKKFWLKNNLAFINIIIILLYLGAELIDYFFHNAFLLNTIGIIYLLIIIPLDLIFLLKLQLNNWLDYWLSSLVMFFTVYIPFYFIGNYLGLMSFNQQVLLLINLSISLITIFTTFNKNWANLKFKKIYSNSLKKLIKNHWPILLALLTYGLIHLINYHFYIFIPEWDGYTKIIEVKRAIELNKIINGYRGFFSAAIISLMQFSHLNPYFIMSWLFILLEATPLLIFYYFIHLFKINNKIYQTAILLATLSIPVLNMEIDVIRPQSIFIILLPIYIYFIFKAIRERKITYWLLSSSIAIMGLNYHEFFVFIFGFHFIVLFAWTFKNYYFQNNNQQTKIIFWLSFLIMFLLSILFLEHFPILQFGINTVKRIAHKIIMIDKWRWWFLGNYSGDSSNYQIGWPGVTGALKYYAYYASPLIVYIIGLIFIYFNSLKKYLLAQITMPLMFFLLIYSEVLPRLNYVYLPERVWIIIDVLVLFLLIPLFSVLKNKLNQKQFSFFLTFTIAFISIGLLGSFYIASQKKALTSQNEFQSAQWIKKNTPPNSIIVTQESNKPLVEYFANRKLAPFPRKEFFDGDENQIKATLNGISSMYCYRIAAKKLSKDKQASIEILRKEIKTNPLDNLIEVNQAFNKIKQLQALQQQLSAKQEAKLNQSKLHFSSNNQIYVYALYSEDKFKGIYAQREWWLKANYYQAKIKELTKKYPLIYNKNGIYIWKIKVINSCP